MESNSIAQRGTAVKLSSSFLTVSEILGANHLSSTATQSHI